MVPMAPVPTSRTLDLFLVVEEGIAAVFDCVDCGLVVIPLGRWQVYEREK